MKYRIHTPCACPTEARLRRSSDRLFFQRSKLRYVRVAMNFISCPFAGAKERCRRSVRGSKAGTWVARMRDECGRQHYNALGAADDARDPDGLTVFSFVQAQEKARKYFGQKGRQLAGHLDEKEGPYTVAHSQGSEEYAFDTLIVTCCANGERRCSVCTAANSKSTRSRVRRAEMRCRISFCFELTKI